MSTVNRGGNACKTAGYESSLGGFRMGMRKGETARPSR